jgi:Uma2 family endonuclease
MSTQPKTFLTPEEYLAIEREAEYKSEYWNGEMFVMSGARHKHNVITAHVVRQLDSQLDSRPCYTYPSDMRVRTPAGLYTYPDAVVVCAEPRFLDETEDTLLNPALIVEVLSPSTEAYNRGRKFELYRGIESLQEYLMIASERVHAELFTRQSRGHWLLTEAADLNDVLELSSCGCKLRLADLYHKVEFPQPEPL